MAFIVETGSIVAGATSYLSVADLDSYWSDRGVTLSETDAQKEAALIIATQYVDLNNNWKGSIVSETQPRDWPRVDVYDDEGRGIRSDEIPFQLKNAVAEYAKRQLSADIQPDVNPDVGGVIREKVDVIEREFAEGTTGYFGLKKYPLADNWLRGLTSGGVYGDFSRVRR